MSFKVIEDGVNRKPLCKFLSVINTKLHLTSYRFTVIAAYYSDFGHFAFLSHPSGDLGTMFILGPLKST